MVNAFMKKQYFSLLTLLFLVFSLCNVFGQSETPGSNNPPDDGLGPGSLQQPSSPSSTTGNQGASLGSRRTEEELKVLAKRIESLYPDISQAILAAVREVPRKPFLPNEYASLAYENAAVPAANSSYYPSVDTTVSMIHHLRPKSWERVLILGINTGYAAALLSRLSSNIFVVELSASAESRSEAFYEEIGLENITLLKGDSLADWKSYGPFNSVLLHGAVSQIPAQLNAQLAEDGVLLVPLRDPWDIQILLKVTKKQGSLSFQVLEDELFPAINLPEDFR